MPDNWIERPVNTTVGAIDASVEAIVETRDKLAEKGKPVEQRLENQAQELRDRVGQAGVAARDAVKAAPGKIGRALLYYGSLPIFLAEELVKAVT